MKKILTGTLAAVVIFTMVLCTVVSAKDEQLPLIFEQGSGAYCGEGGKFYAKDADLVAADTNTSTNGITVNNPTGVDLHCIWADYLPTQTAAGLKYLHYTIREEGAAMRVGVAFNVGWDASKLIELPLTAGEHIIDLSEYVDLNAETYAYIEVAVLAGKTLVLDNFYLSSSNASDKQAGPDTPDAGDKQDSPDTSDAFGIAAVTLATAAAAVVVFKKKH